VDIKEVQNALNDCQSDLAEQLTEFKVKIQEKIKMQEVSLGRIIERKVDHKDLKMVIDEKADRQELQDRFVYRNDFEALRI
jgi:nitrate/nitrite-specific signal transduction histidine kinase